MRHTVPTAPAATTLAMAALAVALSLSATASAAPVPTSAVLPGELAGSAEVLPVSRHKTFVIPSRGRGWGAMRATDGVLVFAPFTANDYSGSWTVSRSHSSRRGSTESHQVESSRSYSFALLGGTAPVLADCGERVSAESTAERRGDPARTTLVDHELRCSLQPPVGGVFELSVANGRGELVGTGGERFAVTALATPTSRWEEPDTTGLVFRVSSGAPLAAVDFHGKGRVVLQRDLEPPRRELLAAAAAALLLADLDRW